MAGAPEVASQDADTRLLEPTQRRARVDVSARAADSIAERLGGAGDEVARVGRHVILRELGRGGMGVVYAAYDAELDRKVAIKVLRSPGASDSHGRARMQREAQALAKLSHPNVVHVYDVGTYEGHVFLAMEYVEGETLDAWLAARPRPWPQVLEKFIAAGRGLAAAHAAGLVHRDFKPQNIVARGR
ncbi:MAG: serine/threonine protein kinase [Myxococcales bacterium]|nr:serine/threonine protein kinase [Myxococcales bacterium]